jgi:hypothetical protein
LAWDYDANGPEYTLTAGSFAVFVNFPGSGAVNYWSSAADDGQGNGFVWGAQVDAPSDAGMALAWNLMGGIVPPPANDCNRNGVPDECDIQASFSTPEHMAFCQGTTYPPCDTDFNHNGVPDHCELCGDLNGDGVVDVTDYFIMLDAFGRCAPDPRFLAAAAMDTNGNNCIDLVDYRAWFQCYRMANGKAFVPPPPKPAPKPQTTPAQPTLKPQLAPAGVSRK